MELQQEGSAIHELDGVTQRIDESAKKSFDL